MKKVILIIMALCMVVPEIDAQNKALQKAYTKMYKAKMKEYKKEGWKLFANSKTLDVVLLTHYDKLNNLGDDGREIVGVSTKSASKNVGSQAAANNAAISYAQNAGKHIRGRIVSDIGTDGGDTSTEFDRFYAAYESLVEKEIKGEMEPSYSRIRYLPGVLYEMQSYYIGIFISNQCFKIPDTRSIRTPPGKQTSS